MHHAAGPHGQGGLCDGAGTFGVDPPAQLVLVLEGDDGHQVVDHLDAFECLRHRVEVEDVARDPGHGLASLRRCGDHPVDRYHFVAILHEQID
ncbi:Uncharacterised protein [Mycobacteroides abscessus subsp. abscessus]|nr:Uncharacterised protein [Mycobacteroides abscessus subsp. abscessus]